MRKMYTNRVGDPSSEFGMPDGGEKFMEKLKTQYERYSALWADFVQFMRDHNVTPEELRVMFTRYYEEFIE